MTVRGSRNDGGGGAEGGGGCAPTKGGAGAAPTKGGAGLRPASIEGGWVGQNGAQRLRAAARYVSGVQTRS